MANPSRLIAHRFVRMSVWSPLLSASCRAMSAGLVGIANNRMWCSEDNGLRRGLTTLVGSRNVLHQTVTFQRNFATEY